MSEADAQQEFNLTPFDARPDGAAVLPHDRKFIFGLVAATVLHVLLLIGFNSSGEQRPVGDPSGARDGISVDLVTESDLRGLSTVAEKAAGAVAPPPSPQQATPAPAESPSPPTPPEPQAQPREPSPPPAAVAAPQPSEAITDPTPTLESSLEKLRRAVEPSTSPERSREAVKPAQQAKPDTAKPRQAPPTRTSSLDLRVPPTIFMAPSGGGGFGVERSPGATRSGENDAFARGVISALQRTMPQLRETLGRVTVRITLDMNGGLVSTQVLRPSNVAGLDQSVVFATKQSSFPFPPRNARPADLVFTITYIYR